MIISANREEIIMATGYTAAIKDGISFEEFTMSCARAFGALVTMRDDPQGAEIPKFEVSTYHQDRLIEGKAEILSVGHMSSIQRQQAADQSYIDACAVNQNLIDECVSLRKSYEAMLKLVVAWHPPTDAHAGLKKFMVEQIEQSIEHDCDVSYWQERELVHLSGKAWASKQLASLRKSIEYHKKKHDEEVERVNERNKWVRELRGSLESQQST